MYLLVSLTLSACHQPWQSAAVTEWGPAAMVGSAALTVWPPPSVDSEDPNHHGIVSQGHGQMQAHKKQFIIAIYLTSF
jgi:hypothetical protein